MSIKFILNLLIATFLSLSFCQAQEKEEIYIPEHISRYHYGKLSMNRLLYNTACYYSLAEEADSAFYYLDLSIKEGFIEYKHLKKDKDLIFLYEDDRWQKIVKNLVDTIYEQTREKLLIDNSECFYINKNDTVREYSFYQEGWEVSIVPKEELIEKFYYTDTTYNLSEIDFTPAINTLAYKKIELEEYKYQFTENKAFLYADKHWILYNFHFIDVFGLKIYTVSSGDSYKSIDCLIFKLKNDNYYLSDVKEIEAKPIDSSEEITFESIDYIYSFTERYGHLCTKNNKWGLKKEGKYIFEPIYDSLFVDDFTSAYYQNKILIYDKNGNLLMSNPKSFYYYSQNYMQVIDSLSQMYFIDTLGNRFEKPIKKRWLMGNDTNSDYYKFRLSKKSKTDTYKKLYLHEYFYARDEYEYRFSEFDLELRVIKGIRWNGEKMKVKQVVRDDVTRRLSEEEKEQYVESYYDLKPIDRKYKKVTFINGKTELGYEPYWYEQGFYGGHLSYSYLIAKKRRKYGMMDFREDTVVIPFLYNKITSLERGTYLILEKEGLKGIYPYFGTKVEFKEIEPFIEFYARFEDIYNRKGWIDRRGNRYYDN